MSDMPVVVLIGAAGGIGAELAQRLARTGARLVLAGRRREPLDALAPTLPVESLVIPADAAAFDQVDALFDQALARFGRVDGAVNLAGSIMLKAAHQTTRAELDAVLSQNLISAFALVRAAGRVMRSSGGSVVLLSSTAARVGLPNHEAIAAAKAAVIGLTQSAAATYAPTLRVNAVAPGLTRTPMARPLISSEMAEKASVAMHPLARLGEPGEIAAAIAWLLSPDAAWITGQVIGLDGGLSTVRPRLKM